MATLTIRPVQPADAEGWLRLRSQLWPEGSEVEHRDEIAAFLDGRADEPLAALVAERQGILVGLAELSIRSCAEGCHTSRIAYLEGWFVPAAQRRQGIGRALVAAAEKWAREAGCTEFSSDTVAGNAASAAAHAAVGFENAGIVVCFRKTLQGLLR